MSVENARKVVLRDDLSEQEQEPEKVVAIKFNRILSEDMEEHFDNIQVVIDYITEELEENPELINNFTLTLIDMLDHVQFYMTDSYFGDIEDESHE